MDNHPFNPDYNSFHQTDATESQFPPAIATTPPSNYPPISSMSTLPETPATSTIAHNGSPSTARSGQSDIKPVRQNTMPDSKLLNHHSGMRGLIPGAPMYPYQMQPMPANLNVINPNHMTSYGTSMDPTLPTQHELVFAKAQGSHIYAEYHPEGAEITHDGTRASMYANLDINNLPKSKDLSGTQSDVLTHFPDALTAEFYRVAARPHKAADEQDQTIPTTQNALRAHVKTLVLAFNSWKHADDNEGMVNPFKKQTHDQKLVEATCWTLLKTCIDRSKSKLPLLFAWDQAKSRDSVGHETFAKRFDAMVLAMTQSKTICKHVFDAPYGHVFVDDPTRAQTRVRANRDLNKQKAQHMDAGKRVLDQQAKENGTYTSPKRAKRARATPVKGEVDSRSIAPSTPNSELINYLGTSPGGPPSSPYSSSGLEPMRRSARQTHRPDSYAYSPARSTPAGYDSPVVRGDDASDEDEAVENVKTEGRTLMTEPNQQLFGPAMPGQGNLFQRQIQQQMQHQMLNYQNLGHNMGYSQMYFGPPWGANAQQATMTQQEAVPPTSSSNQQWNPYASAYHPSFNVSGIRQDQEKLDGDNTGSPN